VRDLGTYGEVSPSGTGLKLFGVGALPGRGLHTPRVELYDQARYFAVTGHRLPGLPEAPQDCQVPLARLYEMLTGPRAKGHECRPAAVPPDQPLGDDEVLRRASSCKKTGAKFRRLWAGDTTGYASPSEADFALVNLLAFWVGPDPARIDALFRRSGLMRAKWAEVHSSDGRTYGSLTVGKALVRRGAFYRPCGGPSQTQATSNNYNHTTVAVLLEVAHLPPTLDDALAEALQGCGLRQLPQSKPARKWILRDICQALQRKAGAVPFHVGQVEVAKRLHVSQRAVSTWLRELREGGILERITPHNRFAGLATEWKYIEKEQENERTQSP
jgi:hypothetical protein